VRAPNSSHLKRRGFATAVAAGVWILMAASVAGAAFTSCIGPDSATYSTDALSTPTMLTCTRVSSSSVQLNWSATASSWADGQVVVRAVNAGAPADYDTVTAGTTSYTDIGASNVDTYSYTVQAKRNSWRSADNNQVTC